MFFKTLISSLEDKFLSVFIVISLGLSPGIKMDRSKGKELFENCQLFKNYFDYYWTWLLLDDFYVLFFILFYALSVSFLCLCGWYCILAGLISICNLFLPYLTPLWRGQKLNFDFYLFLLTWEISLLAHSPHSAFFLLELQGDTAVILKPEK